MDGRWHLAICSPNYDGDAHVPGIVPLCEANQNPSYDKLVQIEWTVDYLNQLGQAEVYKSVRAQNQQLRQPKDTTHSKDCPTHCTGPPLDANHGVAASVLVRLCAVALSTSSMNSPVHCCAQALCVTVLVTLAAQQTMHMRYMKRWNWRRGTMCPMHLINSCRRITSSKASTQKCPPPASDASTGASNRESSPHCEAEQGGSVGDLPANEGFVPARGMSAQRTVDNHTTPAGMTSDASEEAAAAAGKAIHTHDVDHGAASDAKGECPSSPSPATAAAAPGLVNDTQKGDSDNAQRPCRSTGLATASSGSREASSDGLCDRASLECYEGVQQHNGNHQTAPSLPDEATLDRRLHVPLRRSGA